jgi:hypothetical protein
MPNDAFINKYSRGIFEVLMAQYQHALAQQAARKSAL